MFPKKFWIGTSFTRSTRCYGSKNRQSRSKQPSRISIEKVSDVILIKGAALDLLVYDQPWYTVSKDIDLILSARREELRAEEIEEIGCHFHQKGVEFDFFEHHDMNMNGLLPIDFDEVWKDAQVKQLNGETAYCLSPEDMLLSICINSCRKRYFRLKSLLDIVETVEKIPDLDWGKFIQRCKTYGCGNIVYTALKVANSTLGCPIPEPMLREIRA